MTYILRTIMIYVIRISAMPLLLSGVSGGISGSWLESFVWERIQGHETPNITLLVWHLLPVSIGSAVLFIIFCQYLGYYSWKIVTCLAILVALFGYPYFEPSISYSIPVDMELNDSMRQLGVLVLLSAWLLTSLIYSSAKTILSLRGRIMADGDIPEGPA